LGEEFELGELESVASEILHGRNATVFEGLVGRRYGTNAGER
jgi:hypothetical protein